MLIQEFLENSADRLPDKVCLISGGRRFYYGEIEEKANRLANALIDKVSAGVIGSLFICPTASNWLLLFLPCLRQVGSLL